MYTYDDKNNLAKKIESIKKKNTLVEIFKYVRNEEKSYNCNRSGIYILFNNLTDDTYKKISNIVDIELSNI